jgi:adenosylcobinamide-phosphate synthase
MRLELQVLVALALDLLLGDPRWLPHPVKLIGALAARLEPPLRRGLRSARLAGVATVIIVLATTGLVAAGLVYGAARVHPVAGDIVSILLLYSTLAARDLMRHSLAVYRALRAGDLEGARKKVALIVGRDTDQLQEAGVVRATVESVAENIVDGVTAPLFFAVLGGPVLALLYKAVNTLDSTFGYRNERYIQFGWAAARLDDVVNYLPARLTAPLVCLAAALLRLRAGDAWRVFRRDGRRHPSPNSGLTEAAVAGALGVQLGGLSHYAGVPSEKPTLGDPHTPLERRHIGQTNALLLVTTGLATALFLAARLGLLTLIHYLGGH